MAKPFTNLNLDAGPAIDTVVMIFLSWNVYFKTLSVVKVLKVTNPVSLA